MNNRLRALWLFFGLLAFHQERVFALSSPQVVNAYDGCVKFLAMPSDEQAAIAKKSGYSLSKDLWGCQYMVRHGLQSAQEREKEYQRAMNSLRNAGSLPPARANGGGSNSCQANSDCGPSIYQCVGGQCGEVGSPDGGCDNGAHECQPGVSCVAGICQG